ncbi:aspartate-alanine antiporter [Actinomadura hibisca]|uniref:aspartate-alanine antiporter n=1 Tax=Actinomadura hibisca TaxID=68565 RepID=UPI000B25BF03|nr:aspartate-alanine antiporter [Actinomadura hibisca]
MDWLKHLLKDLPELALFLCLALGFALGKVRFWKISLGGVAGTLIVAIFVGMLGVTLNDQVKNIAFALFIFTLGFMAGPSFFAHLNKSSLRYGVFTAIEVVTILAVTTVTILLLDLDVGTAAGLLAGGATESAVLGTATEAIGKLNLPADQITTLQANVGTAYSISYICGLITIVLFTSQVAPAIMRVDLRAEAVKLWQRLGGGGDDDAPSSLPNLVGRVHRVSAAAAGATVGDLERMLGDGVTVERLRHAGKVAAATPGTALAAGDLVALYGPREALAGADARIGPEVGDTSGLDRDLDVADVQLAKGPFAGRTLGQVRREVSPSDRRGVFLTRVSRSEQDLPLQPDTTLHAGDVVRLTGDAKAVDAAARKVGFRLDTGVKADIVYISLGVILGMLIGKLVLPLGDVPLSLGTGGGCLLTGLLFGWLRSRHPKHGQYDPAAASVIKDLGLAAFICAVGLSSGPQAVELIGRYGFALPVAGILMTLVPASISLLVAWKVMKLPAPLALGSIAGQQCSTPAITAIQQAAGNSTPMMAYTIVYALSNVVLPLLGPVAVALARALT